jgi:carboxyl-terminal processing protease
MFSRKKVFILLIVLGSVFAFKATDDYFEVSKNIEIFSSVYKEVHSGFVDEVKPGDLMKKSIDAMLGSLDPYTNFYNESQAEDAMIMRSGEYGGIGCGSIKRDKFIYISTVYKGLAADKAGLRVGDKILEINGKSFEGKTDSDVTDALRGAPNSKASMVVERAGVKIPIEITREEIKIKNVSYYGLINSETGYIKLDHFMEFASKEVREAFLDLKGKGIKKIVLDLRDNGGGLLHEAVNIVNIFVDVNEVVTEMKGRTEDANRIYKTLDRVIDATMPLVVLVNSHSASASEIVCGAIQDLDRGVVIGRNTFGKGLVQNTRPLPYRTQMKMTIAKYYIPSGRCIQLLDYSHRNADGSAGVVPDSLRKAFKTKNGRVVYDGGGVKPDVNVKESAVSNIAKSLEKNFVIFDYATYYRAKNNTITDIKNFNLKETDFEDFKQFVKTKNYTYSTASEALLTQLKTKLKEENYNEDLASEIKNLEASFASVKAKDLDTHQAEILLLLKTEITRRYYYEEATFESTFNSDPDILKALETFTGNYKNILTPTP